MGIQGIVVKVHLTGYCDVNAENIIDIDSRVDSSSHKSNVDASLKLVVDSLVLHDPDPRHLLEHFLPRERLQAVDLQLRVPEVLQRLRRLVDLLKYQNKFF